MENHTPEYTKKKYHKASLTYVCQYDQGIRINNAAYD